MATGFGKEQSKEGIAAMREEKKTSPDMALKYVGAKCFRNKNVVGSDGGYGS